jgi:hypothetical protein
MSTTNSDFYNINIAVSMSFLFYKYVDKNKILFISAIWIIWSIWVIYNIFIQKHDVNLGDNIPYLNSNILFSSNVTDNKKIYDFVAAENIKTKIESTDNNNTNDKNIKNMYFTYFENLFFKATNKMKDFAVNETTSVSIVTQELLDKIHTMSNVIDNQFSFNKKIYTISGVDTLLVDLSEDIEDYLNHKYKGFQIKLNTNFGVHKLKVSLKEKDDDIISDITTETQGNTCEICKVNKKIMAINCGHIFCWSCLDSIQNQNCPKCSAHISKKLRVFL